MASIEQSKVFKRTNIKPGNPASGQAVQATCTDCGKTAKVPGMTTFPTDVIAKRFNCDRQAIQQGRLAD